MNAKTGSFVLLLASLSVTWPAMFLQPKPQLIQNNGVLSTH